MQKSAFLIATILFVSACVAPFAGGATGQLIIGVKDHEKQIGGIGNVSAIDLTVRSVQVHFSGAEEDIEIEAELEDNGTKVETEINDEKTEFMTDKTNRGEIISEIAQRTGLTSEEIARVLELKNQTIEAEESDETGVLSSESGWLTVFEGSRTFNLLDFTGNVAGILGNATLQSGRYQEIRLFISSASITVDGMSYPLEITSGKIGNSVLKLVEGFQVEANKTTLLVLDFDVDQSVRRENDGYRLRSTIKIEEFETDKDEETEIENETGQELQDIEED